MENEQLSFLKPIEKQKQEEFFKYDASICGKCCCNKCRYSVEIYPFLSTEECKRIKDDSCFNCDECYYYGLDNENLNRHLVMLECDKFEMSNHYLEIKILRRRRRFKII